MNQVEERKQGERKQGEILLQVENLSIGFDADEGLIGVTDGVSFDIRKGEIYGLVGESGCGKTVTSIALLRLLPAPRGRTLSGRALFRGKDILGMSKEELREFRGQSVSMIFQEPGSALNPLMTIQDQLREVFDYHEYSGDRDQRIDALLRRVGFSDPERILRAYPHELSGGMAQRVMIAMALLLEPDLIIADEPTTALDVTVQAQIMELLLELRDEMHAAILLITHNMGLIAQYADRVAVMYAGRIVEEGETASLLRDPLHPYSQGLLRAIPDIESDRPIPHPIPGQVPRAADFPSGCRFRERCPRAFEPCADRPELKNVREGRKTACFLY